MTAPDLDEPMGDAPADLGQAGSVVQKAIEFMMERKIHSVSAASALLGGALNLLAQSLSDDAIVAVLTNAIESVRSGDLRSATEAAGAADEA